MFGLVLMRLSGCCISYNSSLGTILRALIPTADADSNTSQLSYALVTPNLLSMRDATLGNSQQVESVDPVLANIYISSTLDTSFNKWLCTDVGVRAGIREGLERNGENKEQGQAGRGMQHFVLELLI